MSKTQQHSLSSESEVEQEQENSFLPQQYLTIGDGDSEDEEEQEQEPQQRRERESNGPSCFWFLNRETLSKGWLFTRHYWTNLPLRTKVLFVIVAVSALIFPLVMVLLFKYGVAEEFLNFVNKIGIWGVVIMGVAIIFANTPLVPIYGVLTIACGFLFGVWIAVATVMVGALIGGCLTFLAARFLLREKCISWIDEVPLLKRIRRRMSDSDPWRIAIILRISGMGIGLCNTLLAVSSITFPMFVLTLPVGEIKRVFVLSFLGSTLSSISEAIEGKFEWTQTRIILLGLESVIAILFIVIGCYFGNKIISQALLEGELEEEFEEIEMQSEPRLDDDFLDDEDFNI